MTVSDIAKIVVAVATTQLLADLLSRRYIFQSESYTRSVSAFERAKARRDKTAAALAAKQELQAEQQKQQRLNPGKKQTQLTSQKSNEKDAKKLQRENDELSELAAEVARRHTMSGFYSSIAFFILYRILAAEYSGKVVAVLPFEPFHLMQRLTFRGLGAAAAGLSGGVKNVREVHDLWMQSLDGPGATIPGANAPISPNVTHASQACAFIFIYLLCTFSVKMMVNMVFGTKPPPGADDGMGTLMESPKSQKMMEKFGLDVEEVKEARKAVGWK